MSVCVCNVLHHNNVYEIDNQKHIWSDYWSGGNTTKFTTLSWFSEQPGSAAASGLTGLAWIVNAALYKSVEDATYSRKLFGVTDD
jgi:hypothetical protein